jgi:hypothetical protein
MFSTEKYKSTTEWMIFLEKYIVFLIEKQTTSAITFFVSPEMYYPTKQYPANPYKFVMYCVCKFYLY